MPRAPILAAAVLALLAGLWAALVRLGLDIPAPGPDVVALHGLLMTLGFLGTVIGLERAVAVGGLSYSAPVVTGLGALVTIAVAPAPGVGLLTLGGALFTFVTLALWRRHGGLELATMTAGALAWPVAGLLWLAGTPIPRVVPLLAAFLVLTIAGERLELSRLMRPGARSRALFVVALLVFVVGIAASVALPDAGVRTAGLGALFLAVWLLRFDLARRTVRQSGAVRYIALCVLGGYIWLAVGGALWFAFGASLGGFHYDAMLHAIFLGFVMSMVLAHELIVVPAVLRVSVPFTRFFYAPLALLHASLAARVAGDLGGSVTVWQWGGTLNVIAVLLFATITVAAVRRGLARRGSPRSA